MAERQLPRPLDKGIHQEGTATKSGTMPSLWKACTKGGGLTIEANIGERGVFSRHLTKAQLSCGPRHISHCEQTLTEGVISLHPSLAGASLTPPGPVQAQHESRSSTR